MGLQLQKTRDRLFSIIVAYFGANNAPFICNHCSPTYREGWGLSFPLSVPCSSAMSPTPRGQTEGQNFAPQGAPWCSGRVSDSESRAGFDPHMCHHVVSFINSLQYWLNLGRVGSVPT